MTMNQKYPTVNQKIGLRLSQKSEQVVRAQAPLESVKLNAAVDLLMSGTFACVEKTALAPLERVKLVIQNQNGIVENGRLGMPYRGVRECVRGLVKGEGILSLWRGNLPSIMGCIPSQVLNFGFNALFKSRINFPEETHGYWWSLAGNLASGGAAGASSLIFLYPLENARTRLATDLKVVDPMFGDRKFKSLAELFTRTLESDGLAGFYRGFGPSCVGVTLYRSVYFGLYESLKPVVLTGEMQDDTLAKLALASGVTLVGGLATYPFDTISRRMMITSTEAFEFRNSLHALSYILSEEGAKSLYKGASVNILRAFASACVLLSFDKLQFNLYPRDGSFGPF